MYFSFASICLWHLFKKQNRKKKPQIPTTSLPAPRHHPPSLITTVVVLHSLSVTILRNYLCKEVVMLSFHKLRSKVDEIINLLYFFGKLKNISEYQQHTQAFNHTFLWYLFILFSSHFFSFTQSRILICSRISHCTKNMKYFDVLCTPTEYTNVAECKIFTIKRKGK